MFLVWYCTGAALNASQKLGCISRKLRYFDIEMKPRMMARGLRWVLVLSVSSSLRKKTSIYIVRVVGLWTEDADDAVATSQLAELMF